MPEPEELRDEETDVAPTGLLGRLRHWTDGHPIRSKLIGAALILALVATVGAWVLVAEIAITPENANLARALEEFDAGEDDSARAIVTDLMKGDSLKTSDYGAALFIMGALKVREAERQWSSERGRNDYFIASKYLAEARTFAFPDGRNAEGLYLLGKSLLESRQLQQGVEALRDALAAGVERKWRAHLLLAEAHFYAPTPNFEDAVGEIDTAIKDPDIDADQRASALLLRSEALAMLGRGVEAEQAAASAGPRANPARRSLAEGRSLVVQLENAPPERRVAIAKNAGSVLERARREDQLSTGVSRESDFLKARIAELLGNRDEAVEGYRELRRSHGTSDAGIAAAFAEGDLLQREGADDAAIAAYRRALDTLDDPKAYRNRSLPLSEVRRRTLEAHAVLLDRGRYDAALQLTDWVGPLVGTTQQLLMQADTLRGWGENLIEQADALGSRGEPQRRQGRHRLRESGVVYERLAEARFATRQFTDDLWVAAEMLQAGQAYGETIRVIERYLRNEPISRNALALLRVGEAHLSRGEDEAAIRTLEECLEFHANDASSYRARLVCARAHRLRGDFDKSEELLRYNLTRTALTPASPEWRDSKFDLGQLLAESGRHNEAIAELEEGINRYPDDPQARLARYQIALSNRQAAQEPLKRFNAAQTVNEREQARREADEYLEAALHMFQQVQREITLADSGDDLDRATLRNCFMLGGNVLFDLNRYEEARQSFASVSTLYQNEPYMLEALVHIYHCWRRQSDRTKAMGVVQQAQQLLQRLPPDADFATSTNLTRTEWDRLLSQLQQL
ncbi:Outer membrane protein assembly factor BamD [Botrimarina colliarenosi]|uniref:Outer membrane protein assembly factor BamD n=1 Tax=Botrimarina colliarenosi TaxID=2528001 RepID=A0A5C6AL15_9BACT|nr:Outer membrane protein assembly factor BamD [Botrimarina colliarenosi]